MDGSVFSLLCPDWRGPCLVIDFGTWQIQFANWECLQLLRPGSPVALTGNRLSFSSMALQQTFVSKIAKAQMSINEAEAVVYPDSIEGEWISARFHIPRGLLAETLSTLVSAKTVPSELVVIEFSRSRYVPDANSLEALSVALGLTPAEKSDLALLAAGHSPETIAMKRNVFVSTVRQRVKGLLAKAQCSRQLELTSRVRSLCPPSLSGRDTQEVLAGEDANNICTAYA